MCALQNGSNERIANERTTDKLSRDIYEHQINKREKLRKRKRAHTDAGK